jgi:hypothetical protein
MEQPLKPSSSYAAPAIQSSAPAMQTSSPTVAPLPCSAASPPGFSFAMAGEQPLFNPHNTPFLQPTSDAAAVSAAASIISLSHTHQVISLKLTNTNYLYWCMQMLPYLLGKGVFGFVDCSNTCPSLHVLAGDGTFLQVNPFFLR